jgi:methyl-accepting chemotaxis protein
MPPPCYWRRFFYLFTILRSIIVPVNTLATQADRLARGDLTVEIVSNSHDEIGYLAASFIRIAASLHETIAIICQTSAQVAVAASQLQAIATQIATGAISTVATGSEELSATYHQYCTQLFHGGPGHQ